MRLRTARWLAATGIAAAMVACLPVSAAAEPAPTLGVILPDTMLTPDSPGTLAEAVVFINEPTALHNLTVKYDASAISAFINVGVSDPDVCTQAGDVITCTFDEVSAEDVVDVFTSVALVPKSGAALGDEGDLKVTVSADGVAAVSDTATVSIAEGVDLAAESVADATATPGGTYSQQFGVQNIGTVTAHGVVLAIFGDLGVEAGTPRFSNCTYQDDHPRLCTFDTDLAADKSYGATIPFRLRSDNLAPEKQDVQLAWLTPAELAAQKKLTEKLGIGDFFGEPGDGPALTLTEKAKGELPPVEFSLKSGTKLSRKQIDEDPANNWTFTTVAVTGNNPADVAAVGDTAAGSAGAEVEVKLGVKNNGPATIDPDNSGEFFADVVFSVPPGASVTEAPFECAPVEPDGQVDPEKVGEPGGSKYVCGPGLGLSAGEQTLFPFMLRIDTVTPNAKGKVEVTEFFEERPLPKVIDSNPNNDVAYVVLNAAAPGSPGGDDDGGLPVTGTPVAIVAGVGLVLAGFGFVLYRAARRRRLTEV